MARIVLVGAGSAQFGLGTLADVFRSKVLEGSTVVLHDINPTALARVEAVGKEHVAKHKLPYNVEATADRPTALKGANYIISSIEVGDRFKLWEQDWTIPQQYGFRQVYGENGGPGGLFHSLRIIPQVLAICDDVMRICPDAWMLNFSNPMSRICTTVLHKYPDLHLVGLCHEIASLGKHLPHILGRPLEDLELVAGGLNHFSMLLEARYKDTGADAYPDIRAGVPAYFEGTHERGLFMELFRRYDLLPITTDSHMGEYLQWAFDVVDHKGILDFYWGYKSRCQAPAPEGGYTLEHIHEGERVIPIIEAMMTGERAYEGALNLPNRGLIDKLPSDIVVEVPGTVDAQGVHGTPLGTLPAGFLGLLQNQVAIHELTAEAVLTGSKKVVMQALLADLNVDTVGSAEAMLDTILTRQSQYLGYIH
ncbi:MAG: alpha-glucosidase [Anaerolineae bacterium]